MKSEEDGMNFDVICIVEVGENHACAWRLGQEGVGDVILLDADAHVVR